MTIADIQTRPGLSRTSTVLAVVPHFQCEEWLGDSLESLVSQTRPLDAIVVIDDASPQPPVETVALFPQVTLLRARENVGPFRLNQEAVGKTGYDAFLFQDADDWSREDRLAVLLDEAERTGAEFVSTQSVRIDCEAGEAIPTTFAYDVNARLRRDPDVHCLTLGASVISARLLDELGGLASGLRVGGDTELVLRAVHLARIVNSPERCTFVPRRAGSLTQAPETRGGSPLRAAVQDALHERAIENARRVASGETPLLEPIAVAPPIRLEHVLGPLLRPRPDADPADDDWLLPHGAG